MSGRRDRARPPDTFNQAAHWRERGDGYRAEIARSGAAMEGIFRRQEREVGEFLATLPLDQIETILEVGCGYGRMTPIIARAAPALRRYVCLDISRGQVTEARRHLADDLRPRVDFLIADIAQGALQGTFDLVVMVEVLLHFPPEQVGRVLHAAQALTRRLFVHVDPYQTQRRSPLTRFKGFAREALRTFTGHRQKTDWLHPYLELYDRSRPLEITVRPILDGLHHAFAVELRK